MTEKERRIGMMGLGVMGRNLVLNMADHGLSVAGCDRDAANVQALREAAGDRPVRAYVRRILDKLPLANRTQAGLYAL
jgi:6-phosphogluconate dehydrogenase